VYEGKPVVPRDEKQEKYLSDKIGQVRSICQWLAGLGIAAVFGQLLRATPPPDPVNRRAPIILGALEVLISIAGAIPIAAKVDVAKTQSHLERVLSLRQAAMWAALGLLVVSLAFLLQTVW
jgi:hypothetical protein